MSNNGDKLYQILSLALATARTNVEIFPTVPGGWDVIRVISSTNSTDSLTVRFPNVTDDGFTLQPGRGVKLKGGKHLPRFFVTNSAISGATMTLLIGGETGADIDVSDQVSVVSLPNIDIQNVAAGFAQDMTRQLGLVDLQTAAAGFTSDITRLLGTTRPWWLNELRAGRAFAGSVARGATAGEFTHVQLFNPAGSGVTAILYRVGLIAETANNPTRMFHHNTALTAQSTLTRNLLAGGAAPACEIRSQTNATLLGSGALQYGLILNTQYDDPVQWITELGAGEGVHFACTVVNEALTGSFMWIEF